MYSDSGQVGSKSAVSEGHLIFFHFDSLPTFYSFSFPSFSLFLFFSFPFFLSLSLSFNDSDLSRRKEMCTFVLVTFIFEGWYKVYLELYCSPYFFYHSLCISFIDFFIQLTWSKVCCVNTITSFQ